MTRRRLFVAGLGLGWWLGRRAARRRGPAPSEFRFLSLMSHELKTPLNVISGYLELLQQEVPDPLPPVAHEHVHYARLATMRMTDLVNNLLTWTRLQGAREEAQLRESSAADIVRDACQSLKEQAELRGIRLETDVPPDLVVTTDPIQACQALRALVTNGLKFTERGQVQVRVERVGEQVRFRVSDTGIGIAPEHQRVIFRPFWQLESTVRRTRGGAGIGLTVARELARLLGGDVIVDGSQPGSGSDFVLVLPS